MPKTVAEKKEEVEKALERLHAQVATLTSDTDWTDYLRAMSAFHEYSPRNTMWMYCQWESRRAMSAVFSAMTNGAIATLPAFSRPAAFSAWETVGRKVIRGEKALSVLAPVVVTDKEAPPRPDGKPSKKCIGFTLKSRTFDVAQTEGDDLPESPIQAHRLVGEAPEGILAALEILAGHVGFTVAYGSIPSHPDAHGVCDFGSNKITVRSDLSGAQTAKTLTHEIAHAIMHGKMARYDLASIETEAESVAYVVMDAIGVEADAYSIGYVASWSRGNGKLIADTAERVLKASRSILEALEDTSVTLKVIGPSKDQQAEEGTAPVRIAA